MNHFELNFRRIFPDKNTISDEVPQIQLEINADHNMRNLGTSTINHAIISRHDSVMQQALTQRQL